MKYFCGMSELNKKLSGTNDIGFNNVWTSMQISFHHKEQQGKNQVHCCYVTGPLVFGHE